MYARMATFEIPPNTPAERGERIAAEVRRRITDEERPARAQHVMILIDRQRNRALNLTLFDTREHMDAAEPYFEAMAPVIPDNPGRRTDVGHFEVVLDEAVAATA